MKNINTTNTVVELSEIAPDHITVGGVRMDAEYSVSSTSRSVYAFLALEGERYRVAFTGECGELFTAALEAAKRGNTTQVDTEGLNTVLGDAKLLPPKTVKAEAPKEVDPAKQRHGEVPEKLFIGSRLEGAGWEIYFDGDAGKTRVIFPRKPAQKVIDAVKAAGFYWSPTMKSWNKGLTFRAYRAAQKLHSELHALTA